MVWAHTYPEWWSTYCQGKCKKKDDDIPFKGYACRVQICRTRYIWIWLSRKVGYEQKERLLFGEKTWKSKKLFEEPFAFSVKWNTRNTQDKRYDTLWEMGPGKKNTVLCIWLCNLHTAEYLLVIHLHSDKWISFLVTCAYKLITARPPARNPLLVYFFRWFCMRLNLSVNLIRIFH